MSAFWMALAYLFLGIFFAGVLYLIVAVCYSTLHWLRKDQEAEDKSETSWNDEHLNFDEVTEFRNDFS